MRTFACIVAVSILLSCCSKGEQTAPTEPQADTTAMRLMEGIWLNDDGEPSLCIVGDSIFFPYNASAPLRFTVISDTIIMFGSNEVKYPLLQLSAATLQFLNPTGDSVTLQKSETGSEDDVIFRQSPPANSHENPPFAINQGRKVKRDTVVYVSGERYHCYMQVNPTTFKVYKSSLNDDGVEIDDIYYDNTVYIAVFTGRQKLYSHEFRKADFARLIPQQMLPQTILSDISLDKTGMQNIVFRAQLAIPDSPTSFIIGINIALGETISMTMSSDYEP